MRTLPTTGLSYSQTLSRLVAYMGERVEVRGYYRGNGASFLAARGTLNGGRTLVEYGRRESECILFVLDEYGAFMLGEGDFIAGETVGAVLRIELRRSILTVSLED